MKSREECLAFFENISQFLDGELSEERAKELEEHIVNCPPCVKYVDSIRAVRECIRANGEACDGDDMAIVDECLKKFMASKLDG